MANQIKKTLSAPQRQKLLDALLKTQGITVAGLAGIPKRPAHSPCPLSFAQQRLWFLAQAAPGASHYNIATAFRIRGSLDVAVTHRVLVELAKRHEALRTVFDIVGDEPAQIILSEPQVELPVIAIDGDSVEDRESRILRMAEEHAGRPFDLRQAPPLRTTLLRVSADEHVFLLSMHHIIADGWSLGVMIQEVALLYSALSESRPSPLPPLPLQYADYADWQRKTLQGDALERQLAYWRTHLAGSPPARDLPSDRPRPRTGTFRGAVYAFSIPADTVDRLRTLARQNRTSLFSAVLAIWKILLYRYTRNGDVVVGSPVANRGTVELERLIGFFVNTLALRTRFSGTDSFNDVLALVRETVLGAYAHQDLPFEKLVAELQPDRAMGLTPFFQVVFTWHNEPRGELALSGIQFEPVEVHSYTTKFDLTLAVREQDGALPASIEYSAAMFDESTIARMAGHLCNLAEAGGANPDRCIDELPILGAEERARLLVPHNGSSYPSQLCLHHLFEAQAAITPNAAAVVCGESRVDYSQLNRKANQLAHLLIRLGVAPEVKVGLLLDRSLDLVAAILGTLKAGGSYVPFDPGCPEERLAFMLQDTQVPVLITQRALRGRLPDSAARVVLLDEDAEEIRLERESNPKTAVQPDNLAYIIYTSGSTGQPKGVMVTHRNVVRLLRATQDYFQFDESDRWTLFHSYAFDFSVWELWGALAYGGRLVVVSYLVSRSPSEFYELLKSEAITVLNQTPSAFRQLQAIAAEAGEGAHLALRHVIFGGEALIPSHLAAWFERRPAPQCRLVNMYGITETTVHVTLKELGAQDVATNTSPIGAPIGDLRTYVLDRRMNPEPAGVPGELYVGGAGVARGYLRRADLTAERFIPDPFAAGPGGRLYRTGDLARQLADGTLEFLGRADDQVKIRGFRIEKGEIEAVLQAHPAIEHAVVLVREDAPGDQRLVAYLTGQPVEKRELRAYLSRKLPPYMTPAAFVFLDSLPLNANGKVDREALPAPHSDGSDRAYRAPENSLEESLLGMWRELLRNDQIGTGDDFFEAGGHSLLAARFVARVRAAHAIELPLRVLFESPTVTGCAQWIELEQRSGSAHLAEAQPFRPAVIMMKRGAGRNVPIYLVHPVAGGVVCYADLAGRLGDRPVFGIQAASPRAERAPDLAGMAAEYFALIEEHVNGGPFEVGGWSFGGLLAFEMARHAQRRGLAPEMLFLLDPTPPHSGGDPEPNRRQMMVRFLEDLLRQFGSTGRAHADALGPNAVTIEAALKGAVQLGLLPPETDLDVCARGFAIFEQNYRTALSYRAGNYRGPAALILPEARGGEWRDLLPGDALSFRVPYDHYSMIRGAGASQIAAFMESARRTLTPAAAVPAG